MPTDLFLNMERAALLSDCGLHRWWLSRRWGDGKRNVTWIMLNPSTADHRRDDPTMNRVIEFSRFWGFDACTVVNVYPFRASSPKALRRWLRSEDGVQGGVADALEKNARCVVDHVAGADITVAAWGLGGAEMEPSYFESLLEEIGDRPLHCLGVTKDGAPKHPLARGRHRVPETAQPIEWRAVQ